jgi:hypothetical protein
MSKLLKNPLALVLLVAGIMLLLWGYNASQSLESQISSVVSGSPSARSMYFHIADAICVVPGLVQLARAPR